MTLNASSDLTGFFTSASTGSGDSDLRSLVHHELRLLAYSQPAPTAADDAARG